MTKQQVAFVIFAILAIFCAIFALFPFAPGLAVERNFVFIGAVLFTIVAVQSA